MPIIDIEAHLLSTYELIECAFPNNIDSKSYFPLLALLYEELSDRNLAKVIAKYTGKDYHIVLNDIYGIASTDIPSQESIEKVKQKLLPCGYQEWLEEEN